MKLSMNVLVVGSSVIDLFFEVEDKKRVKLSENQVSFELGDKIPTRIKKIALGGNGANVSVGLAKLDHSVSFYTYLGNDLFSREIQEVIEKHGIKLLVEKEEGSKSSLSLILSLFNDRIIFSNHQLRNHTFKYNEPKPDFIYLTSIGNYWQEAYQSVLEYVKVNHVPLAFNPGSYQLEEKTDLFFAVLKNTKIIFVNKEEAKRILAWANISFENNSEKEIMSEIKKLGVEIVSLTDGKNGSFTLDENNNFYQTKPYVESMLVVEKTGAGDAYTSGFLAKYLFDKNIQESMQWGSLNAYAVMQKTGAQEGLLDLKTMNNLLNKKNSETQSA